MEAIILKSKSPKSLEKIKELAKTLGVEFSIIDSKIAEDLSLANAIEVGKTGEYIDLADFLTELKNERTDN
ncbi:hypothetical protein [Algoriphagus sp.]|uniref:hypothetical protein n=1 Tax=Algoriphagus sp. TaxID=1872435 RepID=UPI00391BE081